MTHENSDAADVLSSIDLGSSVAEHDNLLEDVRVETSAFADLLNDHVDLIPGTKGSGKSALYRIFVDFLPEYLLKHKKVVIAHGVQRAGDEVFHVYKDEFETMDENHFVDFWCIYLVSLAHERFVKNHTYSKYLEGHEQAVLTFKQACKAARIPEFDKPKPLREVLEWVLAVLRSWTPLRYRPPGNQGAFELLPFGKAQESPAQPDSTPGSPVLPNYVAAIRDSLENLLNLAGLSIWLMIDRLDEVFPRRSETETRALRGLLRTLRVFESKQLRVKVFLRDDILDQIVAGGKGFTALTHVTARKADTLKWSEEQILTMIVKRLFASQRVLDYLTLDPKQAYAGRREASAGLRGLSV